MDKEQQKAVDECMVDLLTYMDDANMLAYMISNKLITAEQVVDLDSKIIFDRRQDIIDIFKTRPSGWDSLLAALIEAKQNSLGNACDYASLM